MILSVSARFYRIQIDSIRFLVDSLHSERFSDRFYWFLSVSVFRFHIDSIFGSILSGFGSTLFSFGSILSVSDFGSILSVSARFYRFRLDSIGSGSILSVSARFYPVSARFYPVSARFYRFGSILSGFGSILCGFGSILDATRAFKR